MVSRVREDLGRHDTGSYADGFPAGATTGKVSIGAKINEAFTFSLRTGFAAKEYTLAVVSGTADYALQGGQHISEIFVCHIGGVELEKDTLLGLSRRDPNWRNLPAATPARYARYANRILFSPTPNANTNVKYIANSTEDVTDLTDAAHTPAVLPNRFHDGLHYGGALLVAQADFENPVARDRIAWIEKMWLAWLADLERYVVEELGIGGIPPLTLDQYYAAGGGNGGT